MELEKYRFSGIGYWENGSCDVIYKNANKGEKSVDFVSKKVYSIQALNERASQKHQLNEKSTDRKKKVLDRMMNL